ncbi:killer cell lectin-like receptor subfamily B member 1B allele B, partial [Python bivittatus]|uniref:Killer cell lectin-like receptor subfamily B member 1B allele B n=1 Tax=Python bivittatus TaxID=176946 RepID=A0A9F5IX43_PYTBI
LQLQRTPDAQGKISAAETVSKENEEKDGLDKWKMLQRFLCKPHCDNSTGNLKLCPKDWLLHENNCYWISTEKQTWNNSRDDCRAKDSKIAMLKEQAELHFIQRISNGAQLLWIGLSVNSTTREWSWIDNSPLNDTLLPITGVAQGNSCGMLKGQKVILESCSAVTRWICETEALVM